MEALDYAYCSSFLSAIDRERDGGLSGNSDINESNGQRVSTTSPDGSQYSYGRNAGFSPTNITPSPQEILNGAYGNSSTGVTGPLSETDENWSLNRLMDSNDTASSRYPYGNDGTDMIPSLVETNSRNSTSSGMSITSPAGSLGSNSGVIPSYPYDGVKASNNFVMAQSYMPDVNVSLGISPNSCSSPANSNGYYSSQSNISSDSDTYNQSIVIGGNSNGNLWTTDQYGSFDKGVYDASMVAQQIQGKQIQSQGRTQVEQAPNQNQNQSYQKQQEYGAVKEEMSDDDGDDDEEDADDDLDYEDSAFRVKEEPRSPRKTTNSTSHSRSTNSTSPQQESSQSRRANTKANRVTKPKKEKTSHNMIEKRYRTNINDKIQALRDCVPSLCYALDGNQGGKEDLEGLVPANKLNKATILVKATEYIKHLQKKNELLNDEISKLKSTNANSGGSYGSSAYQRRSAPRMAQAPMTPDPRPQPVNQSNSGMLPKAMMVSMAGVMATNMMGGNDNDLSGLSVLPGLSFLRSVKYGGVDCGTLLMNVLQITLILGVVWQIFFFSQDEKEGLESSPVDSPQPVDQADPKFLKQYTWLTVSQQLIVPTGNNLLSALPSLLFACFEVFLCSIVGMDGFLIVAQSFRRIKTVAASDSIIRSMDSQLCGGDLVCDYYRIFYMFLRGFATVPGSKRFILQAIQARLLFVGMLKPIGVMISDKLWKKGLALANADASDDSDENESLPSNVLNLLCCPDVLDNSMVSSINDIVFNKSTVKTSLVSFDSILDTMAALYSEKHIHSLLAYSLENGESSSESYVIDEDELDEIDSIAPDGSDAKQAVALIRATYNRGDSIKSAMELLILENATMPTSTSTIAPVSASSKINKVSLYSNANSSEETLHATGSPKLDFNTKLELSLNSTIAIYCSLILHYLDTNQVENALEIARKLSSQPSMHNMELLGFVSLWKALLKFYELKAGQGDLKIERLSAIARIWIGSEIAEYEGLNLDKRRELVGQSVQMNLHFGGLNPE
ncbi:Hms1p [Sugiyamaella lignohabitans]|uniref:Hms1p n=1 Tax=Sugiyamaella lignohabitans TaxID=796027 RepID=A0A167FLN0_9ASCO|nr:Hms1p [Sugiyamaella lignohabitans]ANB15456.1 Hms1p [Sugiyamaella lignohabitans]